MKPRVTMRAALADKALLGEEMHKPSWFGWRVLLIASAGEKLTAKERIEFTRLTGRAHEPGYMVKEFAALIGRRSGKSYAMAIFLVWVACLNKHPELVRGETGVALCISRDQKIAKIILGYCEGIISASPLMQTMFVNRTAETIELKGNVRIEVRPCRHETLRGMTSICVAADELAHWFTSVDFANPDTEVIGALRPSLMTTRGPLLMISSVYARAGVLFETWKRDFGPNGDPEIPVAFGTSRDLNPSLSQSEIDREVARNPLINRAEYLSEFRSDVSGFIDRAIVESAVGDYLELPPEPGVTYVIFIDCATGVEGGDSYTVCVAHRAGDLIVVDALREVRPPFSPATVIDEVVIPLAKAYGAYTVTGDNFGGQFAYEPFLKAGLGYEVAKKHKSQMYRDPFLSLLNSRRLRLPKHDRAINQICALECSTKRSGRDEICAPSGGHDDLSDAIAGAAHLAYEAFGLGGYNAFGGLSDDTDTGNYQVARLNSFIEGLSRAATGMSDQRLDGSLFGPRQHVFGPYQSPFRRGF